MKAKIVLYTWEILLKNIKDRLQIWLRLDGEEKYWTKLDKNKKFYLPAWENKWCEASPPPRPNLSLCTHGFSVRLTFFTTQITPSPTHLPLQTIHYPVVVVEGGGGRGWGEGHTRPGKPTAKRFFPGKSVDMIYYNISLLLTDLCYVYTVNNTICLAYVKIYPLKLGRTMPLTGEIWAICKYHLSFIGTWSDVA
jgi:hypothetical protein